MRPIHDGLSLKKGFEKGHDHTMSDDNSDLRTTAEFGHEVRLSTSDTKGSVGKFNAAALNLAFLFAGASDAICTRHIL